MFPTPNEGQSIPLIGIRWAGFGPSETLIGLHFQTLLSNVIIRGGHNLPSWGLIDDNNSEKLLDYVNIYNEKTVDFFRRYPLNQF